MSTTGGRSASAAPQSHLQWSRVSASQAILDRAYGKAPTLNTSDPTVMKRAIDMSDDELAAIASGAKLTLVKSDT
jgi:hypothetical protein